MRYRVTVLTPTLVGDGRKLAPIDYMVWKDQVNVLDQTRIFRLLSKGPRLEGYLTQLRKAEKLDFASWGGFAQNFADRRIAFEHPSAAAHWSQCRGESLFIPTFNCGPSGPYLPGSAVKGVLRTGFVFSRWTAGIIRDTAGRMEKDRPPRHPAESAEQQTLGGPQHSRMRAVMVSDSSPVSASSFQVYLNRVATLEVKGPGKLQLAWRQSPRGSAEGPRPELSTPSFAEMAKPGTVFEGTWKEPAHFRRKEVLEDLRWRELVERGQLLAAANSYARALLLEHGKYAETAGLGTLLESIRSLEAKLAAAQESGRSCLVCMGWGAGLPSKVAFLETASEDYRRILRHIPFYSKAMATGLPFPKTRRIVFLGDRPANLPGWSLLEVLDAAD